MIVETDIQRQKVETSADLLTDIMREAMDFCVPGITTRELDDHIGSLISDSPCYSAPKRFYSWPAYSCISINEELAHGIAGDRVIGEDDMVKIDISIQHHNGICADMCRTIYHGVNHEKQHLIDVAKLCVEKVVEVLRPGHSVQKVGQIVEEVAYDNGVFVVEELLGHGIGTELHELPNIPHSFTLGSLLTSPKIQDGQLICIEPVIVHTPTKVYTEGRVYISGTGAHGAQYEDMILVTEDNVINLTGGV